MRLHGHSLPRALAVGAISATFALAAALPPYDFTGHWSGTATSGGETFLLSGDLTSTSARKFTGTLTVGGTISCVVKGKRKKKVKVHLTCDDGSKNTLKGQLDTTTQTITGTFTRVKHGKRKPGGTFTLMKTS